MTRAFILVALFVVAVATTGAVADGGSSTPTAWADYAASGSMGLLAVSAAPGTSFTAIQSDGVIAADGVVPADGLAVVLATNDGLGMLVSVGGELLSVDSGDWDWNW